MEEETLVTKKKKYDFKQLLLILVMVSCFFIAGYNMRGMFISKDDGGVCSVSTETKQDSISYTDRVVFSTYGDEYLLYVVDNGILYYKKTTDRMAGLNLCPSAVDYCSGNEKYNNELERINGLTDVVKIKYVLDISASDERFILFAITKNGDVYRVDGATAKAIIQDQHITDMNNFSVSNHYYSFQTEDSNTRIDYTWIDNHFDIKTVTTK